MRLVRRVLAPYGGAATGRPPGALVTVATEDARRAGAVSLALPLGFAAVVGLAAGAVLLRASVPLGVLILLGTPVLMGLGQLLARPLEHRSHVEQERAAHASGIAADLVAGVRVLQGLGAQRAAADRYRRTSRAALGATVRAARAEAVQTGLMQALTGVFIACVALVGGRLVLSGSTAGRVGGCRGAGPLPSGSAPGHRVGGRRHRPLPCLGGPYRDGAVRPRRSSRGPRRPGRQPC